jgi:hypothetical protein
LVTPSDLRKQAQPDASFSLDEIHRKTPNNPLFGSPCSDGSLFGSTERPDVRQNPMVARRTVLDAIDEAVAAAERVIAPAERSRRTAT